MPNKQYLFSPKVHFQKYLEHLLNLEVLKTVIFLSVAYIGNEENDTFFNNIGIKTPEILMLENFQIAKPPCFDSFKSVIWGQISFKRKWQAYIYFTFPVFMGLGSA